MAIFPWILYVGKHTHTHTHKLRFWKVHDIVMALIFSLFLNSFSEIQFTYHKIHLFKVNSSEVYIIFTPHKVVQPSPLSNFRILHHPPAPRKTSYPLAASAFLHPPILWQLQIYVLCFMGLPYLDNLYNSKCGLLCLVSLN